jgi:1,2-diacylglycerol 3-alpha-glucosyltransferase
VENQVICTGYVDWESISGIYRVSDLFVTASMSEVHSMTMIEAMMCSLPVIARKDDSFLGSVQDGVNGYLVESDEGLCEKATELLADEEKLKQFRQASWRIAGEFTGQRHADRMAEFYQRILNGIGTGLPAAGEA